MNASIAQRRLARQLLVRTRFRRPDDVVAWLGAVQAQEFGPAKWALGLRMPRSATDAAIEQSFAEGRILRTHVMRPTWHFVAAADIRWMLELTAPRIHRVLSYYNRQLGLDADVLTRSTSVIEEALGDGRFLTRRELWERLRDAGFAFDGVRLARAVAHAELEGVICSGPRRGKQSTYALVSERAPLARRLPRDEALAALTLRYFTSHGPATARDFAWWSGLTVSDAKRGLEMHAARREETDGMTYWSIGPSPRIGSQSNAVHLLPIYDEYLIAYRDRVAVPHAARTIDADASERVTFQHAIVVGGQVAGTWRIRQATRGIGLDLIPLRRLSRRERSALREAADRYARFIGVEVNCAVRERAG
jgi:hypothetical protein